MIPNLIQAQLQEIYDLELNHQVSDFLITDRDIADALHASPPHRDTEEKLMVLEEQNELNITLFLAKELLSSLEGNNPFLHLNDDNLNDYCTVLEGVSHFTYLTWNASHDRSVSQLELELQAEVDKFVAITQLARNQGKSYQWEEIITLLFNNCSFDPLLDSDELERYQAANDYASSFCTQLESRNGMVFDSEITRRELCRFYRKRHLDKLANCIQSEPILGP